MVLSTGHAATEIVLAVAADTSTRNSDIGEKPFATSWKNNFYYNNSSVRVVLDDPGLPYLSGRIIATGLKPHFAYQIKLEGWGGGGGVWFQSNERLGYLGRWWFNGNKKDSDYAASSNKAGYAGYLVVDYFVTDANGNYDQTFVGNNSYHVVWRVGQSFVRGASDGPLRNFVLPATDGNPAYDAALPSPQRSVDLFGERETFAGSRALPGQLLMPAGEYRCNFVLTEESFHNPQDWTSVFRKDCQFFIKSNPVVTWGNPADIEEGTALSAVQLNAGASVPGSFVYTPANSAVLSVGNAQTLSVLFTPLESDKYTSVTKTVRINVLPIPPPPNQPPVALDDSTSTAEDTSAEISILGNDSDPDGDALTVTIPATSTQGGALSLNNGNVTYTPVLDFNGSDSFSYTLSDGRGGSDTGSVTLMVSAVNDPPVAAFSASPTSGVAPLSVLFDEDSIDPDGPADIVSIEWNYGDGATSSGPQGSHTFQNSSTVTLTVIDTAGVVSTATMDIVVGHLPTLSIVAGGKVAEPTVAGGFTVTRSDAGGALTVNYGVGGSATTGSDYTALSGSVNFPAGVTSVSIPVTAINDTVLEDIETVTVTLAPVAGYDLAGGSATVQILDNEKPTVSLRLTDITAAETSSSQALNAGVITVTRVGNSNSLTVNLGIAGTALNGTDYVQVPASVTFAEGVSSVDVVILPVNDAARERKETVKLTLKSSTAYKMIKPNVGTVSILDND